MAITLLTAVQRVSRNVGLDPTVTAFSESDETNDLVQDIAEAYEELLMALPPECPYLNTSGSLTTVNGTRLYDLASDALAFDIYEWSLVNQSTSYGKLELVSKSYVQGLDTKYDVTTGVPTYLYTEGTQMGVYPVPDSAYTITYSYAKSQVTRLSNTTDTFILPDRWIRAVEKRAQEKYERRKGFGDPDVTRSDYVDLLAEVMTEAWETSPVYLLDSGDF